MTIESARILTFALFFAATCSSLPLNLETFIYTLVMLVPVAMCLNATEKAGGTGTQSADELKVTHTENL